MFFYVVLKKKTVICDGEKCGGKWSTDLVLLVHRETGSILKA